MSEEICGKPEYNPIQCLLNYLFLNGNLAEEFVKLFVDPLIRVGAVWGKESNDAVTLTKPHQTVGEVSTVGFVVTPVGDNSWIIQILAISGRSQPITMRELREVLYEHKSVTVGKRELSQFAGYLMSGMLALTTRKEYLQSLTCHPTQTRDAIQKGPTSLSPVDNGIPAAT